MLTYTRTYTRTYLLPNPVLVLSLGRRQGGQGLACSDEGLEVHADLVEVLAEEGLHLFVRRGAVRGAV